MAEITRCGWARAELDIVYHDEEWGVPVHDDRTFFEFLILEGAQAGLSWSLILKRREHYRKSFAGFDVAAVARFTAKKREALMLDEGLVRNRAKIESTVVNARAFLDVQEEFGSFDAYIWRFVDGRPIVNARTSMGELPARTPESDAMSRDLLKRGFKFVGPTICYAFMQGTGMVNDHLVSCFRYAKLSGGRRAAGATATTGAAAPKRPRLVR